MNEAYYESYLTTLLYKEDDEGEITQANLFQVSLCDRFDMATESETGNFNRNYRVQKECEDVPAYLYGLLPQAKYSLDFTKSEAQSSPNASSIKLSFSKQFTSTDLSRVRLNSNFNVRTGFNIYESKESERV